MFKVVIVDDYQMVRSGLSLLFSIYDDMKVIGTGSNGYDAIALCRLHQPDILVIDYHMPLMDGISAIRQIRCEFPMLMIVLLSSLADDIEADMILASGANLHFLKDSKGEDIITTVRKFMLSRI